MWLQVYVDHLNMEKVMAGLYLAVLDSSSMAPVCVEVCECAL
jgi:hypothetical protein